MAGKQLWSRGNASPQKFIFGAQDTAKKADSHECHDGHKCSALSGWPVNSTSSISHFQLSSQHHILTSPSVCCSIRAALSSPRNHTNNMCWAVILMGCSCYTNLQRYSNSLPFPNTAAAPITQCSASPCSIHQSTLHHSHTAIHVTAFHTISATYSYTYYVFLGLFFHCSRCIHSHAFSHGLRQILPYF